MFIYRIQTRIVGKSNIIYVLVKIPPVGKGDRLLRALGKTAGAKEYAGGGISHHRLASLKSIHRPGTESTAYSAAGTSISINLRIPGDLFPRQGEPPPGSDIPHKLLPPITVLPGEKPAQEYPKPQARGHQLQLCFQFFLPLVL
jgi:hypothetical protein